MRITAACICLWHLLLLRRHHSVSSYALSCHPEKRKSCCRLPRSKVVSLNAVPGADIEQDLPETSPQVVGNTVIYRGKVNEIDFCIAPADVSLSRAYRSNPDNNNSNNSDNQNPAQQTQSMTLYLNNASNRVVRRILLARCWPSAEALNLSLRLVAAAEKKAQEEREAAALESSSSSASSAATTVPVAKCPVPRPILNIIVGRSAEGGPAGNSPMPRSRTDAEYVADQIKSFRERYGTLPGFDYAEAYLESVLSLATSGNESQRVKEVRRLLALSLSRYDIASR